jgi:hypothetical protein
MLRKKCRQIYVPVERKKSACATPSVVGMVDHPSRTSGFENIRRGLNIGVICK